MTDNPAAALQDALAGRYRVERELGRGGMAVVYLAHDLRHDRPVALKVLHPDLAHALGAERFQREIHVAARLQHPNILTVLDSGEAAGLLWFTMPFVEGESLRALLARESQLPVDDAVRIAREAADALDYAHRHGIVHRDIKPDNILLADGHALVADFGIARAFAASSDEHLTATGASIGTAAYMSPEQAAGEREVGPRSDLFSLAIVLYEMLAGTTPFAAATPQATIARRFTEDAAPVRQHRPSVPEHVERALTQALARTAADRFPTARAFAEALATAPASLASSASPASPAPLTPLDRIRRTPAVLVLLAGLLIGGGALFAWSRAGNSGGAPADVRAGSTAAGPVRIAVLPFENLGDSADGYFADGVTDAVRGKLAGIEAFAVIARASSEGYRGAIKPPAQIADELGVHYLLTGTVRWVKAADGTSRVQVSPELVEIGDGTAHTRWGEPFNAPLTDVFEMQQQIAARVSGALDVALGASDQERLAERPTADLEAYNLFLKSEALVAFNDPASLRQSASLLEQAVTRDPSFGDAWARLAGVRSIMAVSLTNPPPRKAIREALDRAVALAPDAPNTYRARIAYANIIENDPAGAMAIGEEAVRRYPNDANLLRLLANSKVLTGDLDGGIELLERAVALDPRSITALRALGIAHLLAGRFAESRVPMQRALALAPGSLGPAMSVVATWLAEGDLAGARRALNAVEPAGGRAGLLAYAAAYGDHYWLLDAAQQDTVLGLGVEWFDDDAGGQAMVFAQILHARGDSAGARRHAAAAAREFERAAAGNPDPQLPALIGLAMALQGRHADARRWAARAESAMPADADAETRAYNLELAARASMLAGDHDAALASLEKWVQLMGPRGRGRARLHPEYALLHGNPRFERLAGRGRG